MDKKIFKDRISMYIVTYATMVVLTFTSILYTTISQKHTEQKFCAIVTSVNDAYNDYPEPTTDLGKKMKTQYKVLEADLGCRRGTENK